MQAYSYCKPFAKQLHERRSSVAALLLSMVSALGLLFLKIGLSLSMLSVDILSFHLCTVAL